VRGDSSDAIWADPAETLPKVDDPATPFVDSNYVPFWAAGTPEPTQAAVTNSNDYYNALLTNEIPLARTAADGTGQALFEAQTVRGAVGLGCGEAPPNGTPTTVRSRCWLVIVPRSIHEVDGSTPTRLESSPLSETNWRQRIEFPLTFLPVGRACAIGS